MKKPKGLSETIIRRRTNKTMAKRKRTKRKAMVDKIPHKKLLARTILLLPYSNMVVSSVEMGNGKENILLALRKNPKVKIVYVFSSSFLIVCACSADIKLILVK